VVLGTSASRAHDAASVVPISICDCLNACAAHVSATALALPAQRFEAKLQLKSSTERDRKTQAAGVTMWRALEIAGWTVWFLIAFAAAIHWALITSDAFVGPRIKLRDALQAWAYPVLCGWFFIIPEWNKVHMIWLALIPFLIAQRLSSHASDRTPRVQVGFKL
jgi:hypothetical protein